MSLHFLTPNNFSLKGNHMCCSLNQGLTLILFFSPDCPHSSPVLPVIQSLTNLVQNCNFAMVNLKQHYNLAQMSKSSSTPITYVPLTILYYKGFPYQQYKGSYSIPALQNFIVNASKSLKTDFAEKASASAPEKQPVEEEKQIPAYTTGVPYCDGDTGICYLNFDNAYKKDLQAN